MTLKAQFNLLKNVDVSCDSYYDPIQKKFTQRKLVLPATFSVTWPDGTPCSLVEIFLVTRFRAGASVKEDGGSLRATVSKLIHLVRHCWNLKRDFWELHDDDIYSLVESLMAETKPGAPLLRRRNNNSVRMIISSVVDFLLWLQSNFLLETSLIGTGPEFRIKLAERRVLNHRREGYTVQQVYHLLPPRDLREPKRPMGRDKRNALWSAISNMHSNSVVLPNWANSTNVRPMLDIYLKARRELLLELLESTGARPGELARLSVSANEDCYKKQELTLITLKRRRHSERKIKLQPGVAMRLTVFIKKHRAALLKIIEASGFTPSPLDRVFIGIGGQPVSERTMSSEFSRLTKAAGLNDYQTCMSMFRHRFITKQVAIHLGVYLSTENRSREMMSASDYRTILKKVATVTGHSNEYSLMHYIDLAWDELGTSNQIETALALDASIESASTQIISIIASMEHLNGKKAKDLLQQAKEALSNVREELRSAIQAKKLAGSQHEIGDSSVTPKD